MNACLSCGEQTNGTVCGDCAMPDAPITAATEPAWMVLPTVELATAIDDTEAWIREADKRLGPARDRAKAMRDVLAKRMEVEGALEITHPYLLVRREAVEHKPVPMISVLRDGFDKLVSEGVLTRADVKPGLWLEQPEPQWRVNLTKLKPLARRFGRQVEDLLKRAILRSPPTFRLTIAANPKVIATTTPSKDSTPTSSALPSSAS